MIKKISLLAITILFYTQSYSQLADGEFAPNFVTTDLEGNQWDLYDILDQGKSVVIDISATWCSPCWDYHQTGELDELYDLYGPDGTDELMVFMVEGDPSTNVDCLYDLAGCNSNTYGDWVTGTHYPIINDDNIADLYEIQYYPTQYIICPNRRVMELSNPSVSAIYNEVSNCQEPLGDNNFSIALYRGSSENDCISGMLTPSIILQNAGTSPVNSAIVDLYIDGALEESKPWSGNLSTYQSEEFSFSPITIITQVDIEIVVTMTNGGNDDFPDDNSVTATAFGAFGTAENIVTLELNHTDEKNAFETYWELLDENGSILYSGGNELSIGGSYDPANNYPIGLTSFEVALPQDGCYEIKLYEFYEDGFDGVSYTIYDTSNQVVMEGPSLDADVDLDIQFLNITGGTDVVDNATIIEYSGEEGNVCSGFGFEPSVTIQNLGSNVITSFTLEVTDISGLIYNLDWTGTIIQGDSEVVSLDEIIIDNNALVTYTLAEVNGNSDSHDYNNAISAEFEIESTESPNLNLEIQVDVIGSEAGWDLKNSAGDILASGSGYGQDELVQVPLVLPSSIDDCYTLTLTDSNGDGYTAFSQSTPDRYFKLTDEANNEILYMDLNEVVFSELVFSFESNLLTSISDIEVLNFMSLYPNPASDNLLLDFEIKESTNMQVSIHNTLGINVKTIANQNYRAGKHQLETSVNDLANGVYFLRLENGEEQNTRRFVVLN